MTFPSHRRPTTHLSADSSLPPRPPKSNRSPPPNTDNWILGPYRTRVALLAAGRKECRQGFSGTLKPTRNSCEYPSKHCIIFFSPLPSHPSLPLTPPPPRTLVCVRCISMAFLNQESLSHSASRLLCVLARFAVHCCVSKLY